MNASKRKMKKIVQAKKVLKHVMKDFPEIFENLEVSTISGNGSLTFMSKATDKALGMKFFCVFKKKSCINEGPLKIDARSKLCKEVMKYSNVLFDGIALHEISNEMLRHELYCCFLEKMLDAARDDDIATDGLNFQSLVFMKTIMKKGTTLEQLLVEMELEKYA